MPHSTFQVVFAVHQHATIQSLDRTAHMKGNAFCRKPYWARNFEIEFVVCAGVPSPEHLAWEASNQTPHRALNWNAALYLRDGVKAKLLQTLLSEWKGSEWIETS